MEGNTAPSLEHIINEEEDREKWLALSLPTETQPQPQPLAVPIAAASMPLPPLSSPYQEGYLSRLLNMPQLIPECKFPSESEEQDHHQDQEPGSSRHPKRPRQLPVKAMKQGKSDTVTAPYPWATSKRATVRTLEQLLSQGITTITGTVQCKQCDRQCEIEYDLRDKFHEVADFIAKNWGTMHDRAPSCWMNPVFPNCQVCGQENCVRPVISKKRETNWLFLFLGQMIGCCKLPYLKYFCKHTRSHRTGAKDRLLYLTYLGLCKQLDPNGAFAA